MAELERRRANEERAKVKRLMLCVLHAVFEGVFVRIIAHCVRLSSKRGGKKIARAGQSPS